MIFVRLGELIAWIALVLGLARFGTAVFIGLTAESTKALEAMSLRYLGTGANSGQAITEGLVVMLVGIALGILAYIAKSVTQSKYPSER